MLSFVKAVLEILGRAFLVCSLVLVGAGVSPALEDGVCGKGVITAWQLNVRTRPSNDSRVAGTLKKGDAVSVVDHQGGEGGWLEIRSPKVNGFIRNRSRYIEWKLTRGPAKKRGKTSTKLTRGPAEKRGKPPVKLTRGPAKKPDKAPAKKAEVIRKRIAAQENEIREFTEKETAIIEGLNDIELSLNRMRARISALKGELETIRQGMNDVGRKKEDLAVNIDKNKGYVAARLNALYRVKMIGRMELMSMPDSMFDFFLQQNALARILASDLDLLEQQMNDLKRLATVSRDLETLAVEKKRLEDSLKEEVRVNTKESLKRSAILKDIQKKKELGLAAVASLKLAAKGLEKKIATLEPRKSDGRGGFSRALGRLDMPVQGTIISRYGPSQNSNYSSFTFQTGIDISVDKGEPVRSVFKGEVLYAEWLKGYGNLIIINHGESFYTLYAHVEEFFKKKGERVDTSEVIALAGDTGSIKGPCLHFEVRHHGKPVDPMKWLKKGA
ncbi:MAG: peptidoglycan DD-metalloendopeptidase family protein [Desulfobacteraceae bacterium]|nr:peptidoglycan DD-metalloendopeptidase family protein [Desulfobacteraceae bacterium]